MLAKRTLSHLLVITFVVFALSGCEGNENKEADIVAEVEGVTSISFNELHNFYDEYLYYLRFPDNKLKGYEEALNSLILRKRKEAEFINTGMYRDKELMAPLQRFINEEIRAYYFEEDFVGKYINEESIQDFYDAMAKEVRYRQIVIPKPQEATREQQQEVRNTVDLILTELRTGGNFADLAKEHSAHISSVQNNGFMPPITWRSSARSHLNRAIFNMEPGSIQALQTGNAFYIVNVTDSKKTDIPPLSEIRGTVIKNMRNQYLDRALEEYSFMKENIIDASTFKWNNEALNELIAWGKQKYFYEDHYKEVLQKAIEEGNNKVIVTHEKGQVDYKKYLFLLNEMLIPGKPSDISKTDLKKFIEDAIRTKLITEKAIDLGYDEDILTENATSILRYHYNDIYTREFITKQLPEPTETALQEFYEAHKDSLLYQYAKSIVYAKLFDTEEKALEMKGKIDAGQTFEQAANRRYKVKSYIMDMQGEIDSYFSKEKPYFGQIAFDMEVEEVRGPVKFEHEESGTQYAILKKTRKEIAKVPEFSEVKEIEKKFMDYHRSLINNKVKKDLAEKYPATIYEEVLEENVNRLMND